MTPTRPPWCCTRHRTGSTSATRSSTGQRHGDVQRTGDRLHSQRRPAGRDGPAGGSLERALRSWASPAAPATGSASRTTPGRTASSRWRSGRTVTDLAGKPGRGVEPDHGRSRRGKADHLRASISLRSDTTLGDGSLRATISWSGSDVGPSASISMTWPQLRRRPVGLGTRRRHRSQPGAAGPCGSRTRCVRLVDNAGGRRPAAR